MMRRVAAVFVGVLSSFLVVLLVEMVAHALSEGVALPLVALGWLLGPLLGGVAAVRFGRWPVAAWVVALVALAAGVANLFAAPHPLWMQAAAVLLPLLAALLVTGMARRAGA